jgi:hypothetical protein
MQFKYLPTAWHVDVHVVILRIGRTTWLIISKEQPPLELTNSLHFEHAHVGGQGIKAAEQSVQHVHDVLWLALLAQGSEGNDVLWQNWSNGRGMTSTSSTQPPELPQRITVKPAMNMRNTQFFIACTDKSACKNQVGLPMRHDWP